FARMCFYRTFDFAQIPPWDQFEWRTVHHCCAVKQASCRATLESAPEGEISPEKPPVRSTLGMTALHTLGNDLIAVIVQRFRLQEPRLGRHAHHIAPLVD